MGEIYVHKNWRNYNKDDYRIETYCKCECPFCRINKKNGQAFCVGRFKDLRTGKYYVSNGLECTKIIKFCFNENIKLIER